MQRSAKISQNKERQQRTAEVDQNTAKDSQWGTRWWKAFRNSGTLKANCAELHRCRPTVGYCGLHTHTHTFNGPFSGTIRVSRYQKGKTNLDFTEARDSEWQWYQLGYMQVCTSLQTDNHASNPPLSFFYRPGALPAAQPTVSKHWRQLLWPTPNEIWKYY